MALMTVEFFSKTLGMATAANVILPQASKKEIGMDAVEKERYPVLWLLHGATDDHTTWLRRTSVERYASERGLAVVMPDGQLSFYSNMAHGGDYYHFIADELPGIMRTFFPLSGERKDNYIAGNSMGGFGAMKIGINHPDRYSAIGCFSAAAGNGKPLRYIDEVSDKETWKIRNDMVYGEGDFAGTFEDTLYMAENNKNGQVLPRIFHTCGTEDFLIDEARKTRDFFLGMEGNPYHYVYEEYGGIHDWEYWDEHITDFLDFIQAGAAHGCG